MPGNNSVLVLNCSTNLPGQTCSELVTLIQGAGQLLRWTESWVGMGAVDPMLLTVVDSAQPRIRIGGG